jgi:uncharacterized protein (UPF0248 family)
MDATAYPIPKEKAVFYFFNPFNEIVLAKVLRNIQESIREDQRQVYIVYCNPIHVNVLSKFAFDQIATGDKFIVFRSKTAKPCFVG